MPVYVYRNLTTGETFEVEQRMTDAALAVDPATGDPVKRLVQPVGIAFKGSGFYVTDSRSNGKRGAGTSNGKGQASDGGSVDATPAKDAASTPPSTATKPPESGTPASKASSSPAG